MYMYNMYMYMHLQYELHVVHLLLQRILASSPFCHGLMFWPPLQILIIPPQPYIVQQPPEHPIESVPIVIIGRMRTSRPTKEVRRQLDYAWSTQAVMAVVWSTQNWEVSRSSYQRVNAIGQ